MFLILISSLVAFILTTMFFLLGKSNKWDSLSKSMFECGFTSMFFSRHSFSIHYFLIALSFLFLDLELCFLLPFFLESNSMVKDYTFVLVFSFLLTLALLKEWMSGLLEWKD